MEKRSVAEIVKTSKTSRFTHYRDGSLWYETDNNFVFPVPIEDIGTAAFLAEHKTIHLMRYIRKFLQAIHGESFSG